MFDYVEDFIGSYGIDFVNIAIAWLLATILFVSLIIYISQHPQKRIFSLKIVFVIMFIGGMGLYCTCHYLELNYAQEQIISGQRLSRYFAWVNNENASWYYIPYVVIRSTVDVCMMFYGRVNAEVFYSLPTAKKPLWVLLFWVVNLTAFYTTATALLIRFGNDLLRWIRIVTSKLSNVDILFGINQNSIEFGRNISDIKGNVLVYVDNVVGNDYEMLIQDMGGITYSNKDAVKATTAFLRKINIKPHKTKLRLFALSNEYDRNLQYARMLSENLEKAKISPEQTSLVLLGTDEWKGMIFQSGENQYGYGNVMSFDEFEMSARLLIYKYHPCNAINFDETGRATEDMNMLIVGFGRIGHEVLRKVIANGQFEGSKFHVTIYEPEFEKLTGFFKSQYPNMFVNYNIDFEPHGGRGSKIFKFLQENASNLKYIVICLEDRDVARDVAIRMVERLQTMGYSKNVYTCDAQSVRCYSQYAKECETHWIYDSELLYSGEIDRYAMELNHAYTCGKDLYEDWKQCGYFERMSSRASVDYLVPLIKKVTANTNNLTRRQRENLAKSEHLRWCAFHYTFGFDTMDKDEFIQRVKDYQNEIRENGKSSIKITKDKKRLKHVCLVSWNELDEISKLENSLTHGKRNYKDSDRVNVDMVMQLIQNNTTK